MRIGLLILAASAGSLCAQMTVTLTSTSSRVNLGIRIGWTAQVAGVDLDGPSPAQIWYRYRVRRIGENYRMVSDFGPNANILWAESAREGTYVMEVTALNVATSQRAEERSIFFVTPLATSVPVITPTSHPLVFIYSAPPCTPGSSMRVEFLDPLGNLQDTPFNACSSGVTMNFYIAGMRANTTYQVHHQIQTGLSIVYGPAMTLTSGSLPMAFAPYSVLQGPPSNLQTVLLQSCLFQETVATDLNGNILWFYPSGDVSYLTRPEPGGLFLGVYEDSTMDVAHQVLREFDLVGNTVQQTNAARINQQLQMTNKHQINAFHHEAIRLPNGNILTLAAEEQILTNVQGPGPVDVLGDMILVLDQNLQVVWTGDAFDYLDTSRLATLGETCSPTSAGCPPVYLAPQANDWLHGNALQLTSDGNILYSSRHQDWVVKIDYNNGTGSGNVLWKLGLDGDFTINSSDPYPWFSHQHDSNFETVDDTLLDVFDDGNLRYAMNASAHSRGQVLKVDETNRVATLLLNEDLGQYSLALGSAQRLVNYNYHFDLGYINTAQGQFSQSVEVDAFGNVLYRIQTPTPAYRSFRMTSLYSQD